MSTVNPLQNLDPAIVREGCNLPPVLEFLAQEAIDAPALLKRLSEARHLALVLAQMGYHLGLVQLLESPVVAGITIRCNSKTGSLAMSNLKQGIALVFTDGSEDAPVARRKAQKVLDEMRQALPFSSVDGAAVSNLFSGVPRGQEFTITRANAQDYLQHVLGTELYAQHRVSVERKTLRAAIDESPSTGPESTARPRL